MLLFVLLSNCIKPVHRITHEVTKNKMPHKKGKKSGKQWKRNCSYFLFGSRTLHIVTQSKGLLPDTAYMARSFWLQINLWLDREISGFATPKNNY